MHMYFINYTYLFGSMLTFVQDWNCPLQLYKVLACSIVENWKEREILRRDSQIKCFDDHTHTHMYAFSSPKWQYNIESFITDF